MEGDFNFKYEKAPERKYKSYASLSGDAIIAGLDSQLLYEAFGLGYRTAFFTIRGFYMNDNSLRFAWPKKTEEKGSFWTNIPRKANIENIMNYLVDVKKSEWEQQIENYRGVMAYDPANKMIRQILREEKIKLSPIRF